MRPYLGLLIAACIASVVLSGVRCARLAAQADFETVARAVREAYREGDLVVVVPFHQATPRTLLGDLPLVELRRFEPDMLRLHPRLLLVAVNALGDQLAGDVESLGSVEPLASAGRVRAVAVVVRDPARPVFELRERLSDSRVLANYGGAQAVECAQWDGTRFRCPRDGDWNYVGRATLNLEDGPRACVWMHPLNGGRELTVTLPEVAGSRLLLGHGFVLSSGARAPVQIEVRRGATRLHSGEAAPRSGWQTSVVPLDGDGPIVLSVRTQDNGGAHFCANAWVLP